MNEAPSSPTVGCSKSRCPLKRRHLYLIGSLIAIAVFVTYLTDHASRRTAIDGLVGLGVFTMVVALAAFFKAYSKD